MPSRTTILIAALAAVMPLTTLVGCRVAPEADQARVLEKPAVIKFSSPQYQAFFTDLRADCLNPAEGDVSTPENPVSEDQMQGYCACYVETFKDVFSEKEIDEWLVNNKALDERKLSSVDQTCSPEIN